MQSQIRTFLKRSGKPRLSWGSLAALYAMLCDVQLKNPSFAYPEPPPHVDYSNPALQHFSHVMNCNPRISSEVVDRAGVCV